MANTNRVTPTPTFPEDTRVILYKSPGPSPERVDIYKAMSYIHAADEAEAKTFIEADGWYRTPKEAHEGRAVSKASAASTDNTPAQFKPEVQAMLDDLKGKKNDKKRVEYAAGLSVDVAGMDEAAALEAIGKALTAA